MSSFKSFLVMLAILIDLGCSQLFVESSEIKYSNTAIASESIQRDTQSKILNNPFLGEWVIAKQDNKEWFAIKIIENEKKDNSFYGILTDEGSLNLNCGTAILEFHKVGNEYWGKLKTNCLDPCKVLFDSTNQKITIIRQCSGIYQLTFTYSGTKLSNNHSFIENQNTIEEIKSSPLSQSQINSNSNSFASSPSYSTSTSGYGETSEITGRAKTVHVNGYYRKDGTYVKSHYRSAPRRK